jgi:tetratricopeptide (TPR) repeat protein
VGDRVRVTAQLIHASTDAHIWAERYDRPLTDVLSVHREVARAIAREIRVVLTRDEQLRLSRTHPMRPDAYEAYLRGRYHWRRVTDDGFGKARECLDQAIALAPLFAEAHGALADVHIALGVFGLDRPEVAFAEAEASARRALALDPNLADAHRAMALVRMFHWDWTAAEAAFAAAMATAPGAADTHCHYALLLVARGRNEEAVASAEHARRLDPLSPMINNDRAFVLWTARRYEDAIAGYRQTLDLEPHFGEARRELGLLHASLGHLEAALPELERAVTLARDVESLAYLGYGLASAGREREAHGILIELDSMAKERHVESFARAVVSLGLRDHDQALEWLERSCDERSGSMLWLASWPLLDPLRAHPRFRTVLTRVAGGQGEPRRAGGRSWR